ncbi:MAG: hypothetical protein R3F15_16070 [Lysobacterales bacterium]
MLKFKHLALAGALSVALIACGKKEEAAAPAPAAVQAKAKELNPVETLQATTDAFKKNDLGSLLALTLPPAKLDEIKADWDKNRAEPITEEDRKEFADGWGKLVADGAVDKMMAEVEPQLEQMKMQLPMMMPMFQGMATMSVSESTELSDEQKTAATGALNGLFTWAQTADLANGDKLRQALTIAHERGRSLNINSLDDVKAMEFDQMLAKGSVMLGAVKEMLNVYGLSLDDMAGSMQAEQVSMEGDMAKVRTSYTLFGQQVSYDTELVKQDGRWYSKDGMESFEKLAAESEADADGGDAAVE